VAWTVARLFLLDNGVRLDFAAVDAIPAIDGLAAGAVTQKQFAGWLRKRLSA
jgi:death-on-curing protein